MNEIKLEPGKQLYEEGLITLVIEDKLCPLPGSPLWNDGMTKPKYVWADMSNPGEEPEVVKDWYARNQKYETRMQTCRNARSALQPSEPVSNRWPGIVGY